MRKDQKCAYSPFPRTTERLLVLVGEDEGDFGGEGCLDCIESWWWGVFVLVASGASERRGTRHSEWSRVRERCSLLHDPATVAHGAVSCGLPYQEVQRQMWRVLHERYRTKNSFTKAIVDTTWARMRCNIQLYIEYFAKWESCFAQLVSMNAAMDQELLATSLTEPFGHHLSSLYGTVLSALLIMRNHTWQALNLWLLQVYGFQHATKSTSYGAMEAIMPLPLQTFRNGEEGLQKIVSWYCNKKCHYWVIVTNESTKKPIKRVRPDQTMMPMDVKLTTPTRQWSWFFPRAKKRRTRRCRFANRWHGLRGDWPHCNGRFCTVYEQETEQ